MKHTTAWPVWLGYLYIILPVLIFLGGFCNIPTALLAIALIALSSWNVFKNAPRVWCPANRQEWLTVVLGALLCVLWVYSSGIGVKMFQNPDHGARNAIFELLVTQPWPVLVNQGQAMLTYYIGFWLPAAVLGKLFHSVALGYNVQLLWATLGAFLSVYYLLALVPKKNGWVPLVFIFFSGLDIVGSILFFGQHPFNPFHWLEHLEWWIPGFQLSAFTTQLYWVFNQAIPAWVLTLLLLQERNNKSVVFLYACGFICATLPTLGLLPVLIWKCVQNGTQDTNLVFQRASVRSAFKNSLTVANLAGAAVVTVISYAYLSGNISGGQVGGMVPAGQTFWVLGPFCLFFMLEVGFYLLCVAHLQYKNPLFYICLGSLLVYPFIRVGGAPDFCMRATIPALLLLCLFVLQSLQQEKSRLLRLLLMSLLLIGAITPLHEMARTVVYTSKGYIRQRPHLEGGNFFSYTQGNMFLQYFGKRTH